MATDIETGESVVLDHGSLAQAMRASMSVPGAIAPVEIDGRLLVDGGIANNLPIDEARKLCADVVIAVNISTPPLKRSEITSALSVAGQLVNFLGKQTVDEQLKSLGPQDVLIAPDLGDISAATFDRSADAIRIGEEATRAMADSLRRYSLPPRAVRGAARDAGRRAQGARHRRRDPRRRAGAHEPGGAARAGREQARRAADRRRRSAPTCGASTARGDFESISYHIVGGDTGPRAMVIEPREKIVGRPTTCGSASASRATSRATTSSTCWSSTAGPGSTAWAASG